MVGFVSMSMVRCSYGVITVGMSMEIELGLINAILSLR